MRIGYRSRLWLNGKHVQLEQTEATPMPVQVSVLALVKIGRVELWPNDFRAMVDNLQTNPQDRLCAKIIADYLAEASEPELEYAFRWYASRKEVKAKLIPRGNWELFGLPYAIERISSPEPVSTSTLPGALLDLWYKIEVLRKAIAITPEPSDKIAEVKEGNTDAGESEEVHKANSKKYEHGHIQDD